MLRPLSSFEKVTPKAFNELLALVNKFNEMSVSPPLELFRGTGRVQLRIAEKGFLAAITARYDRGSSSSGLSVGSAPSGCEGSGNRYSYDLAEVHASDCGSWTYVADGREVFGATEWNDYAIEVGTVVWVEPFGDSDYRFDHPGTGQDVAKSSSSGGDCQEVDCLDVVVKVTCEDGEVVETTKSIRIRNGRLCVSDVSCNPSSSSSSSGSGGSGDEEGSSESSEEGSLDPIDDAGDE